MRPDGLGLALLGSSPAGRRAAGRGAHPEVCQASARRQLRALLRPQSFLLCLHGARAAPEPSGRRRAAGEGGQGRTCQKRKEGVSLFCQLGDPTNRLCVGVLGVLTGSSRLPSSSRAGPAAGARCVPSSWFQPDPQCDGTGRSGRRYKGDPDPPSRGDTVRGAVTRAPASETGRNKSLAHKPPSHLWDVCQDCPLAGVAR